MVSRYHSFCDNKTLSIRTPCSKVVCQTRQIKDGGSHLLNFVDVIGRMADNPVDVAGIGGVTPAIVVHEMALPGGVHCDGNSCKEEDNII